MWKPPKNINNRFGRIVALIDMDCFYCQVEEQLNPNLKGKPIIVQPLQYDDYGGGGCIAINYVAKDRGVTRSMRGDEAKKICSDLQLVRVPVVRGKADLSKYRNAGKQVAAVLQTFTPLMTRASVDEAYLDLTQRVNDRLADMNSGKFSLQPNALTNTFVIGYRNIGEFVRHVTRKMSKNATANGDDDDFDPHFNGAELSAEDLNDIRRNEMKLLIASSIVNEIRATVKEKTGYECSAGIGHNKILAKIVCGLNKPNKQTLLPIKRLSEFYKTLPIMKIQGLGGKFGDRICNELNIQHMDEMLQFTKTELQQRFDEKNGQWLYNLARGIDVDNMVTTRLVPKSINCSKMFPRHNAIVEVSQLRHWLHEIVKDVIDRIEEDEMDNNRRAKQMVVSFTQTINSSDVASSRTVTISAIDEERMVNDTVNVIKRNTTKFLKSNDNDDSLNNPIKYLGFNVNKFEDFGKQSKTIEDLFVAKSQNKDMTKSDYEPSEKSTVVDDDEKISTLLVQTSPKHQENKIDTTDRVETEITLAKSPTLSIRLNHKQEPQQRESPKIQQLQCETCKEMIEMSEMQVHADEHLAFQLNQEEQRHQEQRKRSTTAYNSPTTTPTKKRQKIDSHQKNDSSSRSSIKQFFIERCERTPEPATTGNVDVEMCSQCGKEILTSEWDVHLDFHVAKQLRDEQMRDTKLKSNPSNGIVVNKSTRTNKTRTNKRSVEKKNNSVRNITAFFQSSSLS